jgi:stage VI sporulation protein D
MKGGVALSQENQSCLRFSLEESLWFRKGQEVAELMSISLDPDITIQENDQYVTIRGSLELTGEYKSYEDNDSSEDENVSNQKYIERVDTQEEGSCEFSHRFPVDITIPNNRIQSIYDIDVIVESFDYSIPERSCLKLTAELMISGLYDTSVQEEQEREEVTETIEEEPQYEVVHRYQAEDQPDLFQEKEEPQYEVVHRYQSEFHQDLLDEEEEQSEDSFLFEVEARKQSEEEKVEVFPTFPNFNYEAPEEPSYLQEARSEVSEPVEEEMVEQENVLEEAPKEPVAEVETETIQEESSSSPEEQKHPKTSLKQKLSKKKTMTLTEFFARKEESSDQARLKVCIVQKGDTLEGLAERYDVSVSNILKVNNLELNQDVYEGQVLYVPAVFAKK